MRIIFWWPYSTDKLRGFWTGGQKGVPSGPSKRGFCSGGDVALVQETAEKFVATQLRQDTLTGTTEPGVITTKKVEQEIASRIEDDIAAIDHYGNVTGSNALGKVNLGAVLGCRHFGDAVVKESPISSATEIANSPKSVL